MTIGKILIVSLTTIIVNLILQANGFNFVTQMVTAAVLGISFGIVDAIASRGQDK